MQTITLTRQHLINGEKLTGAETILCNAMLAVDIGVFGQTARQHQAFAVTASAVQSIFITSDQPVTIYTNGTDAQQTVTITGSPTGGTFTLSGTTPAAWTTAGIAWNATAAQVAAAVQAAIVLVSGGALTTVAGTGGPLPGSGVILTFGGTLAMTVVATITATLSGLTGGSPACTPTSTTSGVAPSQTWALGAGQVIAWAAQDGIFSNPITSNITQLSVSNLGTLACEVNVRIGTN